MAVQQNKQRLRGKKTNYTLGEQISKGGEGTVYKVVNRPDLAAKIYLSNKYVSGTRNRNDMDRKIQTMLDLPILSRVDKLLRIAWPQDILYDQNGMMVGYIMPYIAAKYKIFNVSRETERNKIFPDYNWKNAVQIAYNLAWIVHHIHSYGIVIGDMNPQNIMIDETGCVMLIDTDSFYVKNSKTGESFPCEVGLADILAPELQMSGDLTKSTSKFTESSDDFSLAIHLFRLLMNNYDPFNCVNSSSGKGSTSMITPQTEIIKGNCAYVRSIPGISVPSSAPPFSFLPSSIQTFFRRTFYYDETTALLKAKNRTTAEEWKNALWILYNSNMTVCTRNSDHIYPSHNSKCPWCGGFPPSTASVAPSKTTATKTNPTSAAPTQPTTATISTKPITGKPSGGKRTSTPARVVFIVFMAILIPTTFYLLLSNGSTGGGQGSSAAASSGVPLFSDEAPQYTDSYILPTHERQLNDSDLEGLSRSQVQNAINEIYARYGATFQYSGAKEYFLEQDWYVPDNSITHQEIVDNYMTDLELENLHFLVEYQKMMGWR